MFAIAIESTPAPGGPDRSLADLTKVPVVAISASGVLCGGRRADLSHRTRRPVGEWPWDATRAPVIVA
jgi:hypothetical protein